MIDRKWIGHEFPPVAMMLERGRLQFFAAAIGETDPIYTDLAAAQAAGYPDLPAPPTFLMSAELDNGTFDALLATLDIPIARILHGAQGFSYHRPACAGETVSMRTRIADIYDKKSGKLEFVVKTSDIRNAQHELVAELRASIVVRN